MKQLFGGLILSASLVACPLIPSPDAGIDGGGDAGLRPAVVRPAPDASTEHLPVVTPSGRTCASNTPGVICVAEGWFQLSQWSTQIYRRNDGGWAEHPRQTVFLEQFYLDEFEVTNERYERYLADAGVSGPPALCGCTNEDFQRDDVWETVSETSGWTDAGRPELGRARQPVVCVTRAEAMAYCASRGGRLPSVAEFMKAARGAYPSVQRTPWGDEPPSLDDDWSIRLPANFFSDYLAANLRRPSVAGVGTLNVPDVGSRQLGRSATGAYDLTGSVSEFASECLEQLGPTFGSDPQQLLGGELPPLIKPDAGPTRASCVEHVLVVGDNWFSSVIADQAQGSVQVYARAANHLANVGDRNGGALDVFGNPVCPGPADEPGNTRRSWSIGFRCAYDTPPSP